VQAHTLGEVGILGTVLLRVSSRTVLSIFIEIGSYLTDKEQKISWQSFFRHGVFIYSGVVPDLAISNTARAGPGRIWELKSGRSQI